MNKKASAIVATSSILILLGMLIYVAVPRESLGTSAIQVLLAVAFALFISLLAKLPASFFNSLKKKPH
jgi:hypothetical protein